MGAWAAGAVVTPIATWIWLRKGWRRPAVAMIAFAAGLVGEAVWLYDVASHGVGRVIEPDMGLGGRTAWGLGVTGLAALAWSLAGAWKAGRTDRLEPDRVLQAVFGLFGTGVLLQQIARALA